MPPTDDNRPRELYILGMLSLHPAHGHELSRAFRVSRADQWVALSEKHIYYVLRKLVADGLVTEREERPGSAPPRRVHAVTEQGLERLRALLRSPALRESFFPAAFDAVVGMLAATHVLPPDECRAILRARREVLVARLAEHPEDRADGLEAAYGFLARSLYDKARLLGEAELRWLDGVIARAERADWVSLQVPIDYLGKEVP